MSSAINELIDKLTNGRGRDALNAAERETIKQYEAFEAQAAKEPTIEDVRNLLTKELERAHAELTNWQNPKEKTIYYQAYASLASILFGLLDRPEARKKFLETLRQKHNLN